MVERQKTRETVAKLHSRGFTKIKRVIGSRAQVLHGTAYKTSGGLMKDDLVLNIRGRIVSRRKQAMARQRS